MPDQKDVQAPEGGGSPESPVPAPLLTEATFVDELLALFKRGEAAGLSPATIAVRVCFRRGVTMLDGFLASIETSMGSGAGKKE